MLQERNGEAMFRYRLHSTDGNDLGEATHPGRVNIGEELFSGGGRRFRVLQVVLFEKADESLFVGMLRVEAA
jgi:hypothetical protein